MKLDGKILCVMSKEFSGHLDKKSDVKKSGVKMILFIALANIA